MSRRRHSLQQVAAVPFRRGADGGYEVLLVTSRETRRWVIPKGWPMPGKSDWEAAATEAFEEAGVRGRVSRQPLGSYTYFKRRPRQFDLIDVTVYPLEVTRSVSKFKERKQREAQWRPSLEAAELVHEPGLRAILSGLDGALAPVAA